MGGENEASEAPTSKSMMTKAVVEQLCHRCHQDNSNVTYIENLEIKRGSDHYRMQLAK